MQNFSQLFIFLLIIAPLASSAYTPKEGNVTATLGPYFFKTNYTGSTPSVSSPPLTGIALIANGDVNDHGALEIALFYFDKLYFREQNGYSLAEKTALLQINMGYRYWFTSWLSSSLAFYSAYTTGAPITVYDSYPINQKTETSAHATTTYGFDLALQQEIWNQDRFSVLLDERYSKSVTSRSGESGDDYGVMVGFRYFIQAKQIKEGPAPGKK